MNGKEILKFVFDQKTYQDIIDFCTRVSNSDADYYIVMSRKAACFVDFLEKNDLIKFNGIILTDRILDFEVKELTNKKIIVIDDVVVSGTTIYNVIKKLKRLQISRIEVYVLGVNEKYFNDDLFSYEYNNEPQNYIKSPYVLMSDEGCTYTCSNIAKVFALDASPYDVDFPKHDSVSVTKDVLNHIILSSDWISYDVSSSIQSDYKIKNITLLPSDKVLSLLKNIYGNVFFDIGKIKIRLFAKYLIGKKKEFKLNVVPYFIFNEISEENVNLIFDSVFFEWKHGDITTYSKLRILQYVLAEKIFLVWSDACNKKGIKVCWTLNKKEFSKIFPVEFYDSINNAIISECNLKNQYNGFQTSITYSTEINSCICNDEGNFLQTKLVEPFTDLYFNKEIKAREIVKEYGRNAFQLDEYKEVFYRLNHGYSYKHLLSILSMYPEIYDKETTVSLFIDKAIDSGVIVPIIADEADENKKKIFYRAFRHGEDIPFGEHKEKMCAILLSKFKEQGGKDALSNVRVEKLLVLFLRIGELQNIFRLDMYDSIYYKYNVDVSSYIFGNIVAVNDRESKDTLKYLKYKSDVRWLTDVLKEKEIIKVDNGGKIVDIDDPIDIAIDKNTIGKVSVIGRTFGQLYYNNKLKKVPYINDEDFVLFSTCLFPQDVLHALAAELAIFNDRFTLKINKNRDNILNNNFKEVYSFINSNELYKAINSGRKKYDAFVSKEALHRIEEISIQLSNDVDLRIFGDSWSQFWPDNLDWNEGSIESTLLDTINKEAKMLFVLNILCRIMLFMTSINCVRRKELYTQIREFANKAKKQKFLQKILMNKDITSIITTYDKSFDLLKDRRFETSDVFFVFNTLCSYNKIIPSILSDVDLLINKHGKVNAIIRYNYAVCIMPNCSYELFGQNFCELLHSNNLDYQHFPIKNPSSIFPEPGLWFFLKGKNKQDVINQMIVKCMTKKLPEWSFKYAKVYVNVSEELKLKVAEEGNSRQRFGNFPVYSKICTEQVTEISMNENEHYIYWYVEDCKANSIFKSRIKYFIDLAFDLVKTQTIKFETISSSKSSCYILKYNDEKRKRYQYESIRKRYLQMKKCKVFISYSEDSEEHVKRVKRIADHLINAGMDVLFYGDALFGTDMIEFMREIKRSDITLIIGTEKYQKRAYDITKSGVSFEDRLLANEFMSDQRNKIVPIAFGDFEKVIPAPFNVLKGMTMTTVTNDELDTLTYGLMNKYKKMMEGA